MKKHFYQAVLSSILWAGASGWAFSAGAPPAESSGALVAQVQADGRVHIFEGSEEVAYVIPQVFLKDWKIFFFSSPAPGEKADAVAKLSDGTKVFFDVSVKSEGSALKVHGVMTPQKDVQVLTLREALFTPYKNWEGDSYDIGHGPLPIPHAVISGAGVIADGSSTISLGPSHKDGLTIRSTSALPSVLQDARQWGPDLSIFYRNDLSGTQVWDWKSGEKKAFDFTLSFNHEVVVEKPVPPKSLGVLKAQMDELIKPYIDGGWCPGFAVGVLYKGETWVGGYGTTSLTGGKTPDGDTEYEIGSITKLFTKLLFSDMVHQGLMGLDDKAQSYLPKGVTMPSKDGKDITLLMLSNHTSQLPHDPDDVHWDNTKGNPYENYGLDKLYAFLNRYKLTADPGGNFQYSNAGLALLGNFVAQRKGISWTDYVQKKVLDPVGMKDTGVSWTAEELPRAAQGYDGAMDPIPFLKWDNSVAVPAGALHSTVNDMLKLAHAALEKEDSPLADIAFDDTAQKLDWGPIVTHDGGTDGFNTSFFADRKQKAALVLLGDCSNGVPSEVAYKIRGLLKGYVTPATELPVFTQLPPDQLKQYVGKYHVVKVPSGWPTPKEDDTVELKDGFLYSKANKNYNHDVKIEALANGDFYQRLQRIEFSFTKDADGKVTGYALTDYPDYVAEKVDYQAAKAKTDGSIPPPP